jgi:hypothetical protein
VRRDRAVRAYFGYYADVTFEDTVNPDVINTAIRMTAPAQVSAR